MATFLVGGLVVAGLGAAVAGGAGAWRYRRHRKRARLEGNQLLGCPLSTVPSGYFTEDNVPLLVEKCCEAIEERKSSPAWATLFQTVDPDLAERHPDLSALLGIFSSPKVKTQRTAQVNRLNDEEVLSLLLYYLVVLPEPLCTYGFFDRFVQAQEQYRRSLHQSEWRDEIVELLYMLLPVHRSTIMRLLRTLNSLLTTGDDVDRLSLDHAIANRMASAFLEPRCDGTVPEGSSSEVSPPSPEQLLEGKRLTARDCVAMMVDNYSSIASGLANRNLFASDEPVPMK